MAAPRIDRTERLLNLVFALMGSGQPVSRASIAASIPGYDPAAGQAAFERMFERDKDELRGLGIPIRTVLDVNGDVSGYTIDRDAYALPEISFTASERSALALAASAWQNALVRSSAAAGLRKLESESGSADLQGESPAFVARIDTGEASLLSLLGFLRSRQSVTFDYKSPQSNSVATRHVDPWGLIAQDGGWYVVGHDRDRDATRAFRLSRMRSEPRAAGAVLHPAPAGVDLRSLIDPGTRGGDHATARVRVAAGGAAGLRRLSTDLLPADTAGILHVSGPTPESLLSSVLFAGDDAEVHEPTELREAVIASLTRLRDLHAQATS
jgi:proteasome accessory factor B